MLQHGREESVILSIAQTWRKDDGDGDSNNSNKAPLLSPFRAVYPSPSPILTISCPAHPPISLSVRAVAGPDPKGEKKALGAKHDRPRHYAAALSLYGAVERNYGTHFGAFVDGRREEKGWRR